MNRVAQQTVELGILTLPFNGLFHHSLDLSGVAGVQRERQSIPRGDARLVEAI